MRTAVDNLRRELGRSGLMAATDCDNQHRPPLPSTGAQPRGKPGSAAFVHFWTGPTTPSPVRKNLKLTVSRETFLARLGVAVRAASTRSAIQTLAGVLIRVEEDHAELQATDMELGLRVTLEPESSTPGPGGRTRPAAAGRRPLAAEGRPDARVPERPAGRGGHLGPGALPPAHAAAGGLPEAAGGADHGRADAFPRRPSWTRSPAWPGRPRATRRGRTSPACSSPPAAASCAWSPPTPTGSA